MVSFLDKPPRKNPRVFIKENENVELYFSFTNDYRSCFSEDKQVKVMDSNLRGVELEPQTHINRSCKKKYIRLKE